MFGDKPETELLAVPTAEGAEWMPVQVKRSSRARRLRITIGTQGEVILTLPRGCSRKVGIEFLNRHGDWMKKHLGSRRAKPKVSLLDFLQKQGWLAVDGKRLSVALAFGDDSKMSFGDQGFQVFLSRDEDHEAALCGLLRKMAPDVLKPRLREFAQARDLPVQRITVRNQKSRWGSCSDRGTISLNWRLVLVRPELQDYILLHELAHLTEMNHSDRFWSLLQVYDPQARKHDREVTRISREVMALGR